VDLIYLSRRQVGGTSSRRQGVGIWDGSGKRRDWHEDCNRDDVLTPADALERRKRVTENSYLQEAAEPLYPASRHPGH